MEFLIRRIDGKWFDLPPVEFSKALHPNSFPSKQVAGWGDYRIEVAGCEVSFSFEDPGIQIVFETGNIAEETAAQIVSEILQNIERTTGQKGRIVAFG